MRLPLANLRIKIGDRRFRVEDTADGSVQQRPTLRHKLWWFPRPDGGSNSEEMSTGSQHTCCHDQESISERFNFRKIQQELGKDREAHRQLWQEEFDFESDYILTPRPLKNTSDQVRETKRTSAFDFTIENAQVKASIIRLGLIPEQKAGKELDDLWKWGSDKEDNNCIIKDGMRYHTSKGQRKLLKLAHGSPMSGILGRKRTAEKSLHLANTE